MEQRIFTDEEIDRIVQMAWEDRTPFEAIAAQFGLSHGEVIKFMRKHTSEKGWKRWRKHTQGRSTKHLHLRAEQVDRFRCSRQRHISDNKVS